MLILMALFVNTVFLMPENRQKAFRKLRKAGYHIIIHSCRTSFQFKDLLIGNQFDRIKEYMKYYKLNFDDVWMPDKSIGVAYIDDRAINYKSNWGEITEKLLTKSRKCK